MKALTNIKAVRAFACLLVVSVLTTIASPLHLVFAAPTSPKKAPQNGVLNQLGNFFTGFGREKTNSPFDKKYQNSVLKLMGNFIFARLVLPKLEGAGCTFKNVAEYGTNPKCFPESTTDAKKKLTLATIQKNLLHEVYAGTSGKCGAHRDGRKGAYTIEQCIGYPWGVEKCTVMDGNISALGITIPKYCAKKSVSTATSGASKKPVNGIKPYVDNLVNNFKNATSGGKSNKATQHEIKAHLTDVLNSNRTYKGSCKATTLEQLTTLPDCNTSALMNPDNYKTMKEVWRTLYTVAYDASSGDYGISRQNTVGRKGSLYELGIVPNYSGDANKLVDGTTFFGVKLTTAEKTKISIGQINAFVNCTMAGFAVVSCACKLPDEIVRSFLQTIIGKDVLPEKWKLKYGSFSIGEFAVDFALNTFLVYATHALTNTLLKIPHILEKRPDTLKTLLLVLQEKPDTLKSILLDSKLTFKIALVGPIAVIALTVCKELKQCDQPFKVQSDAITNDAKKGAIIAAAVSAVFCWGEGKNILRCVLSITSGIVFEFTAGHFIFPNSDNKILPPGNNHTTTRASIGLIGAYGGYNFTKNVLSGLGSLLLKISSLWDALKKLGSIGGVLEGLSKKMGARKWAAFITGGLFVASQITSLQNDLRAYDTFTQHPNCINSPSCSFAALKTADTISNHPIPKSWDMVAGIVNNIRISNVATISGNTLTIPADKDLKLIGSLFSKIEHDKNTICKTYRPRTNLDATFKEYLPTACKNASII